MRLEVVDELVEIADQSPYCTSRDLAHIEEHSLEAVDRAWEKKMINLDKT